MSLESVKNYLTARGYGDKVIVFEQSSATVALAAEALGCDPGDIAKSLTFLTAEGPILVLCAGDARIDNGKFKAQFHEKARMIPHEEVEELIGHAAGGVCPFDCRAGVRIFLDGSLEAHPVLYPAAGDDHSCVKLTLADLHALLPEAPRVDVTK